jgi:hypothetical protein
MRLALLVLLALCACGGRQPTPPAAPRARARVSRPAPPPRLTPALALATIEARYVGGMRRCYRARLKRDPRARGRVVVTFTVDGRGQVAERRARGVARAVERCVENAMARWTFARPAAPTTFRLAFRLSSRS